MILGMMQKYILGGVKVDPMFIFLVGWIYSLGLRLKYGVMSIDGVEPSGPYKVGITENFHTKKGNFCAIFYPIDQDTKGKFSKTMQGYINGKNKQIAATDVIKFWEKRIASPYEVRSHLTVSVPVQVDAEISKDFTADKKLPVVIFSHGLSGCAKNYTVICREIASYGVVVIALDHLDESAGYTKNLEKDKEVPFNSGIEFDDQKRRKE